MVVKSTFIAWIRRRRDRKFNISSSLQNEFSDPYIISKDPNDSMAPISLSAQECQLDLSSSEICRSKEPTRQTREGRTLSVKLKKKQCHIKQSLYAWHFVARWNQIKRYQKIYLCDHVLKEWRKLAYCIVYCNSFKRRVTHKHKIFWFYNMQEITDVVDRREIRHIYSIWTKCFDQCLLKRFLGYWSKHCEVVHGPSRREMHQLFQRQLTKGLIEGQYVHGVLRQKLRIHAVTICVNKHKTTLLDGMLSCWSFVADKTLSNKVIKFILSLQISLQTKCFFLWRESSYQQKILNKKGKFLAWRFLLWWQKYVTSLRAVATQTTNVC